VVAPIDGRACVTGEWASRFVDAHRSHPSRVIRAGGYQRLVGPGPRGAPVAMTRAVAEAASVFSLAAHVVVDQLPLGCYAVPAALLSRYALRFDERISDGVDRGFATAAAMLAGVYDTGEVTCVRQCVAGGNAAGTIEAPGPAPTPADPWGLLSGVPVLVAPDDVIAMLEGPAPAGSAAALDAELIAQVSRLQAQAVALGDDLERATAERDEARGAYREIADSELWRVTGPARRALGALATARAGTRGRVRRP